MLRIPRVRIQFISGICVCLSVIVIIWKYTSVNYSIVELKHINTKHVLKHEELHHATGTETQPPHKWNNSHSRYSSKQDPLHDYAAFPCVHGLPPFPDEQHVERGKCVRTINGSHSHHVGSVRSAECVSLNTLNGLMPICIHDAKVDMYISRPLKMSGMYESQYVYPLCKKLTSYPDMEFLDLGCNIGVYSLSAARVGKRVVSVDPLIRNLQLLSKSLSLGGLHENVTLIWNAVSNDYRQMSLLMYEGNIGGTAIQNLNETNAVNYHVRTIRLDDLTAIFKGKQLVMKMDVETQELNVLRGGTEFFDQVDVRFIHLEIAWHRKRPSGPVIVDLLRKRGFQPYTDIGGALKLDPNHVDQWPGDVYFIKNEK